MRSISSRMPLGVTLACEIVHASASAAFVDLLGLLAGPLEAALSMAALAQGLDCSLF